MVITYIDSKFGHLLMQLEKEKPFIFSRKILKIPNMNKICEAAKKNMIKMMKN